MQKLFEIKIDLSKNKYKRSYRITRQIKSEVVLNLSYVSLYKTMKTLVLDYGIKVKINNIYIDEKFSDDKWCIRNNTEKKLNVFLVKLSLLT